MQQILLLLHRCRQCKFRQICPQAQGGPYCRTLDDYRMPNREEAFSMFYNKMLLKDFNHNLWTSTLVSNTQAFALNTASGKCLPVVRTEAYGINCVKR